MADDKTPRNTTTTLNANTTTGDAIDERTVTQEDGTTIAKRAVTALGHSDSRLVDEGLPLPTQDAGVRELLGVILEELRAMRFLLEAVIDDTSTDGTSTVQGEIQ